MTNKILAGVTALAIAAGAIVSGAGTAEAKAKPMMRYNPTYCVLFLPFLCLPPPVTAPVHKHKAAIHKMAAKAKAKRAPKMKQM